MKEILKNIIGDKASDQEIRRFDELNESTIGTPGRDFTKKVMKKISSGSEKIGVHIWGIMAGVVLVIVLWGMEGFVTPEISIDYSFLNLEAFELTQITRVFMMANALLLLLLIDRIVQKKKRVA